MSVPVAVAAASPGGGVSGRLLTFTKLKDGVADRSAAMWGI
jgi:hypothetical protein